ncbi:MAG: SpoIIE family protein phosphatase [Cyanobium sp.]
MLADGIGHGAKAHRIVMMLAERLKLLSSSSSPVPGIADCLTGLHQELQLRIDGGQAAVALVDVNTDRDELAVISVGNIQVHYFTPATGFHFPSMHGMVGGRFPRQLHVVRTALCSQSLLALFSDGVDSAPASRYLGDLHARSTVHGLQIQAEVESVVSRFGRSEDDASCALLWFEEGTD